MRWRRLRGCDFPVRSVSDFLDRLRHIFAHQSIHRITSHLVLHLNKFTAGRAFVKFRQVFDFLGRVILRIGIVLKLDGIGFERRRHKYSARLFSQLGHYVLLEGRYQRAFLLFIQRRSDEHTSELQSPDNIVCRLLLEKKKTSNKRKHRKRFEAAAQVFEDSFAISIQDQVENGDEGWKTLCLYGNFVLFFKETTTCDIYTLSLHDALPI